VFLSAALRMGVAGRETPLCSRPSGAANGQSWPQWGNLHNEILAALPRSDIENIRPHLQRVTLISGQTLHEPGNAVSDLFFVEEGVVSLTASADGDDHVEVGLTGREGFVGASVILNVKPIAVHRAITQAAGHAHRITAAAMTTAMSQSLPLRDHCLRYVEMLMIQSSQVAACNARHNLPERLARWLLMVRDRIDTDNLPMTQEFLSVMLGVRRSGVSVAANTLRAGGLIQLDRGQVIILDREALAGAACECYRIIQGSRDRILGKQ
jgi:CRP-like cAMP-binding protein